jgi:beta-barrel assembly-enhancing protease
MRFRLLIPLTLALAVCAQDQPAHTPGAGINFYSLDREIAMGAQLAEAVRRESKVLDSDLARDYVARLGRQLALETPGPKFPYTFTVLAYLPASMMEDPTHEPMALPGGPIFIPASLILEAQDTAELAGMIAHAIAHVADRDCTRSKTRADLMQLGAIAGSQSPGCWVGQGDLPLGYLSFQRACERQADYFAIQIMAKAGYDPVAMAAYIRRSKQEPGRQAAIPGGFSQWPTADERIKQIEKEIRKMSPDRRYPVGENIEPIQLDVRNLLAK